MPDANIENAYWPFKKERRTNQLNDGADNLSDLNKNENFSLTIFSPIVTWQIRDISRPALSVMIRF